MSTTSQVMSISIEQYEKDMGEVKQSLNDVKGDLKNVVQLLAGNPLDENDKGMIGKLNRHDAKFRIHDQKIEGLTKAKNKLYFTSAGVGIGFGVAFAIVKFVLEYISKH